MQVPGRMERIQRGQPFTVIVDFAHTPNALDNALRTARSLTVGKLTWCLAVPVGATCRSAR